MRSFAMWFFCILLEQTGFRIKLGLYWLHLSGVTGFSWFGGSYQDEYDNGIFVNNNANSQGFIRDTLGYTYME